MPINNPPSSVGVPLGGVVAWLKSFTGTPALPTQFAECNGQVLSDASSPYNGLTLPDLNTGGGNPVLARYLIGGTTSGTTFDYNIFGSFGGTVSSGDAFLSVNHLVTDIRPPSYTVVWVMRIK